MSSDSILFIGLQPEERAYFEALLPQFDIDVRSLFAADVEEVTGLGVHDPPRLIVYRVGEARRRPDQDVRRLKRLFSQPRPLFALLPQEMASRAKDLVQGGADDFWVMPLDEAAFPNRFGVMLEWGQAMMRGDTRTGERPLPLVAVLAAIGRHLQKTLHSIFTLREPSAVAPAERLTDVIAGKWEKQRRLGFGSFGEVWLVRAVGADAGSPLMVAKVPHDKRLNTKFLREAAILRRLAGHPHSVQMKEIVKEEGRVVLIQEYVAGRSLQEHFEQGMDALTKERSFLELLEVVSYAHQKRIMHRDIKPENIIIKPAGGLKLLDFGTAKDLTRRSMSHTVIGSRPFMAPEQILGNSRLASDVWALGVILYTLATECLPFYDDNEKQLMDLILETDPERPRNLEPEIPEALEEVIWKCLRKDLSKRYRDALELRSDLLKNVPDFGNGTVLPGSA